MNLQRVRELKSEAFVDNLVLPPIMTVLVYGSIGYLGTLFLPSWLELVWLAYLVFLGLLVIGLNIWSYRETVRQLADQYP